MTPSKYMIVQWPRGYVPPHRLSESTDFSCCGNGSFGMYCVDLTASWDHPVGTASPPLPPPGSHFEFMCRSCGAIIDFTSNTAINEAVCNVLQRAVDAFPGPTLQMEPVAVRVSEPVIAQTPPRKVGIMQRIMAHIHK